MSSTILIIIGVVVIIAIALTLYKLGVINPEAYFPLIDCCSSLSVFGVTLVITIGAFLLWHNLLVAALAGGSVMTILFLAVFIAAASSRPESQSS